MKRRDLMPPPWLMFPHILKGSIGWRMGYGEVYLMRFLDWFNKLEIDKQEEYKQMFSGPLSWTGWGESDNSKTTTTFDVNWAIKNSDKDYLLFWGHRPSKDGRITKSCLSQWWKADFKVGHLTYTSMEQYMMACKARLFKDYDIEEKIMSTDDPRKIKSFGRMVKNFDSDMWDKNKNKIVVRGNYCKFTQNIELRNYLLSSKDSIIVEASPQDRVWGVGMSASDRKIYNPSNWKGTNLLGFALMKVRENIRQAYKNEGVLDIEYWKEQLK